jgi:hypothetical protein
MEVNGELQAPGSFTQGERTAGTRSTGGWVAPRAGVDAVAKRKNPFIGTCRESNPDRPARSLVTTLTAIPRLDR